MEHNFKIYKITNTANGKSYIGQTIQNISRRWGQHKARADSNGKSYLYNAIRKYGPDFFEVEVLVNALRREFLNNLEIELIAQCNTFAPNGYNLTTGGGVGTEVSEITREKLRLAQTGKRSSEATKKKLSELRTGNTNNLGKKLTDEHKKNISKAGKGRKFSDEHKRRIGLAHKGMKHQPLSEARKQQISEFFKGHTYNVGFKHTEATKKKMSESSTGHKHSEETKRKMSKAQIGKKHSEESKLKISLAQKGRKHSEESKKKIGIASMGNTYCLGHKLTEEHKIKLRDSARRGILNHNSKGLIHTPYGTFNTTQEAADNLKCAQQTISKRCNKTSPQWSKWYYEKPKSTENQQNKCDSLKQSVSLQK